MVIVFRMISNAIFLYICYRIFRYFKYDSPEAQERQRKETTLTFDDGVSWTRLQSMARSAIGKHRLIDTVTVNQQGIFTVKGAIKQGTFPYEAHLDFNDWGHLTGRCWKSGTGTETQPVQKVEAYLSNVIRSETHRA